MDIRSHRILLLLSLISLVLLPFGTDGAEEATEYEVKAAFLYNFARFVEWPPEVFETPESPFIIGVVGESPFDGHLERAVEGKTIKNRPVRVAYFGRLDDLTAAHVLFISDTESRYLPDLVDRLAGEPVLTVSDIPNFARTGGLIRFFIRDFRVAFEINVDAAERAGLRISSRLLNVARIRRD